MPFTLTRWLGLWLICTGGFAARAQDLASAPSVPADTPPAMSPAPVMAPAETPALAPEATPSPTVAPTPKPRPKSAISIEIDLNTQKAYLLHDGRRVNESPVSSGRSGHLTPTGTFEVLQKDPDHFSSLYGQFVDRESGRVVVSGADASMPVPHGCLFKRAPMRFFLRFEGAAGMHAGVLPGYAASHGCVRMPLSKAKLFYNSAELGSMVKVYGTIPARVERPRSISPPRAPRIERAIAVPTPTPVRRGWFHF